MVRPDQEAALNQDENTASLCRLVRGEQNMDPFQRLHILLHCFLLLFFCLFKTLILRFDYHECLSAIKPELQGLCAFALLYTPILLVTEYSF